MGWDGSGWVEIFQFIVGWVRLGQSADGLGWIGSHKMDPWATLLCRHGGISQKSQRTIETALHDTIKRNVAPSDYKHVSS